MEVDGVGGGQGWVEKGKGGHTMTLILECVTTVEDANESFTALYPNTVEHNRILLI